MSSNFPIIDRIVQNRVLSHILFWCSFLFIFTLLGSLNSGSFRNHLINYLVLLPSQLAAAYFLNYYQIPVLFLKKRYVRFVISFLLSGYVFVVFARMCNVYIAEPLTREGTFETETILEILADPFYLFYVYFPAVYVIVFLMIAIKSIKKGFEEKHQLEVLQKEKSKTELQFLKAQIHPHFLFNTLNSIYALTLTKSDAAPEVVLKLSEMLDYILYQCNEPTIALHKEVTLIQGYIDLEQIRYGDPLDLDFTHELAASNTQIAPLILLGFIENAFKHGASKNPINPKIHIHLQEKDSQLYLRVYNTKVAIQGKSVVVPKKGIGITNVSRQLEIHYPGAHELKITDTATSYEVQLTIDLTKK
jgi:sensor histidine kinase YesM